MVNLFTLFSFNTSILLRAAVINCSDRIKGKEQVIVKELPSLMTFNLTCHDKFLNTADESLLTSLSTDWLASSSTKMVMISHSSGEAYETFSFRH